MPLTMKRIARYLVLGCLLLPACCRCPSRTVPADATACYLSAWKVLSAEAEMLVGEPRPLVEEHLLPDRFEARQLARYGDSLMQNPWRRRVRCAMRERCEPDTAVFAALCREFNRGVRDARYTLTFFPLHGDAMQAAFVPRSDYLHPGTPAVSYLLFFAPDGSVERFFRASRGLEGR